MEVLLSSAGAFGGTLELLKGNGAAHACGWQAVPNIPAVATHEMGEMKRALREGRICGQVKA